MRTLIPYASAPGPKCRAVMGELQLPNLQQLLQTMTVVATEQGREEDLTPLHERIQGQLIGIYGADGLVAWAALVAEKRGLTINYGRDGWAWITPCHWVSQPGQIIMLDPQKLAITSRESDALWRSMQPYFLEVGITLFPQPSGFNGMRWLAHGAVFKDFPTVSLDRVCGQSISPWMQRVERSGDASMRGVGHPHTDGEPPPATGASTLRRLQNDMQMLLHIHPANDARAKFHLPSVNSFWVSGTGTLADPATRPTAPLSELITVRDSLRNAALDDDEKGWTEAWEAMDSTAIEHMLKSAQSGKPQQLVLCGSHQAITLEHRPLSTWEKLQRRLSPQQVTALLQPL